MRTHTIATSNSDYIRDYIRQNRGWCLSSIRVRTLPRLGWNEFRRPNQPDDEKAKIVLHLRMGRPRKVVGLPDGEVRQP
jgi:hypothetical protein